MGVTSGGTTYVVDEYNKQFQLVDIIVSLYQQTNYCLHNQAPYEDIILLQQMAKGDEKAFRQLFDQYHPALFSYMLKLTDNRELAEDIIHETFLKIWLQREQLQNITNFHAYIFRMARNLGYDGFRRAARERLILAEWHNKPDPPGADPEEILAYKEVRAFILQTLDKLTPQQRQVYILSREQGLKQEQIATQLGISVLTVKRHLTDALRVLRNELANAYPSCIVVLVILHRL